MPLDERPGRMAAPGSAPAKAATTPAHPIAAAQRSRMWRKVGSSLQRHETCNTLARPSAFDWS